MKPAARAALDGGGEYPIAALEFAADINERVIRTDRVRPDQNPLEHLVRRFLEEHVILERAGFRFIAIADHETRPAVVRKKRPFAARGNPAPPRPRRPLFIVMSATSAGFISVSARFH